MIVWRVREHNKQALDELWTNMVKVVWYMNHPPDCYMDPNTGTDLLRFEPELDLEEMVKLSARMLTNLETLWLAHQPVGTVPPKLEVRKGRQQK